MLHKSSTQLDREIAASLADAKAADAIAQYGRWRQSYSNEDVDRIASLALRLTDIDRAEGRVAPAYGYSYERYADAKHVVKKAQY